MAQTFAEWVSNGYYGSLRAGVHLVTSKVTIPERTGGYLSGQGAARSQTTLNYAAGATVLAANGIADGEPIIEVNGEGWDFERLGFHGRSAVADATYADYLLRVTDPGGGSANAGGLTLRNCVLSYADTALLQLGQTAGEDHCEHTIIEQCRFTDASVAVQVNNAQAMGHVATMTYYSNCPICWQMNGGGNLTLVNPVVLSPGMTLVKNVHMETNNCTLVINNFKFDNQATSGILYESAPEDANGNGWGQVVVNGGMTSRDDYAANNWYLAKVGEGQSMTMNGVWKLQAGMFRWHASNAYNVANYILVGCMIPSDPATLMATTYSTGTARLQTYGCHQNNGDTVANHNATYAGTA